MYPFVVELSADVYFLNVTECAQLLAKAIHPPVSGELSIAQALAHHTGCDVHFSEAKSSNAENVVLRRAATETFHLAGLQTAIREGGITLISPMTFGPLMIQFDGNVHWQSEVEKGLVSVCDFAAYAARYGVGVQVSAVENPLQSSLQVQVNISSDDERAGLSRREHGKQETEGRHQEWINIALAARQEHPEWPILQIATHVRRQLAGVPKQPSVGTIRNVISNAIRRS